MAFKKVVVYVKGFSAPSHIEFTGHELNPSNNTEGQLIIRDITEENGERKVRVLGVFNKNEWEYWMYVNED